MAKTPTRCSACGKPVEDGADSKRITEGKMREGEFVERKSEMMHRSCHNRRADGPEATFDELKRQARASGAR